MVPKVILVCMGFAILQTSALGQESFSDRPVSHDDLRALRAELKSDIGAISQQIAALRDSIGLAGDGKPQLTDEDAANAQLERRVEALEDSQRVMQSVQRDQGVVLGQIAMQGESGGYHWRFDANSQSARQELRRALKSTAPERGHLIIHNRTNSDQWILVNGYQHRILAGAKADLEVVPGTVSTQLPGQQVVSWHIGMPDYYQGVDINPGRQLPVVQRWVYSPSSGYVDSSGWIASY